MSAACSPRLNAAGCAEHNKHMAASQGLDALTPGMKHGGLARPRRVDIGAALNRLRSLHMEQA